MLGPKTGSLAEQPTCLWTSVETIVLESFHFFNWCFGLVNHKTLLQVLLVHPRFSNYMRSFVEERRKLCCENFSEKLRRRRLVWDPMGSHGIFISCFPDSRRSWITSEIQALEPLEDFHPRVRDILRVFHYVSLIYAIYVIYAHSFYIQSQTGHFRYQFLWLAVFVHWNIILNPGDCLLAVWMNQPNKTFPFPWGVCSWLALRGSLALTVLSLRFIYSCWLLASSEVSWFANFGNSLALQMTLAKKQICSLTDANIFSWGCHVGICREPPTSHPFHRSPKFQLSALASNCKASATTPVWTAPWLHHDCTRPQR